MYHLCIHPDQQLKGWVSAGDVLRRITQWGPSTKLLEPDQIGVRFSQSEEELCFSFESILWTVVDDRR